MSISRGCARNCTWKMISRQYINRDIDWRFLNEKKIFFLQVPQSVEKAENEEKGGERKKKQKMKKPER